jgi:hypothetical protein
MDRTGSMPLGWISTAYVSRVASPGHTVIKNRGENEVKIVLQKVKQSISYRVGTPKGEQSKVKKGDRAGGKGAGQTRYPRTGQMRYP